MKQVIKAKLTNIVASIAHAREELESIQADLQERFDDLEDQDSTQGEELVSAIDCLTEATTYLYNATDELALFP